MKVKQTYKYTIETSFLQYKGCFISFDPLFIFLLSLPYSIVERYWIYIFEEQHLSYQSKKKIIQFA